MPPCDQPLIFVLATTQLWQDGRTKQPREAVDFHDCIAFGKLGQIIAQYCTKGAKVYLEGGLRNRVFVTRNGQKRTTVEIVCDSLIMLGSRTSARNGLFVSDDTEVDAESAEEGA
jgi:single-strand DNA-binding protein